MKHVVHALVLVCAITASARADFAITIEFKDLSTTPPTTGEGQMLLGGDRLKMDVSELTQGEAGSQSTMIYRGDLEATIFVDHSRRSYSVLDQETMTAVSRQLEDAMKEMEAQLAQMPPEQREMMKKFMKGKMPQAPAELPVYETRRTERKETINGHGCVCYEIYRDGARATEVWVTGWKSTPIAKEDFAVFKRMTEFYKTMLSSMPGAGDSMRQNFLGGMDDIDGFPVLVREFDGDTVTGETLFRSVEKIPSDASAYEAPDGYKEQKMFDRG